MADIDNDGDLDLLGRTSDGYGFDFIYQENTGTAEMPAFSEPRAENPIGFAVPRMKFSFQKWQI